MSHKIKLGYIGLGAVIMLIGMGVGSTLTTPLIAQRNGVFDEITCRYLKVVNQSGEASITLDSNAFIGSVITMRDLSGKMGIMLLAGDKLNGIQITDNEGKVSFDFSAYADRNEMIVRDKSSGEGIGFYADSNEAKLIRWEGENNR